MMLIIESGQRGDELRSSNKDCRHHERYNLDVAIGCKSGNTTRQCSLHNISLSGAYIETDQQIKLHQQITLVLSSPTIQTSCSIDDTTNEVTTIKIYFGDRRLFVLS